MRLRRDKAAYAASPDHSNAQGNRVRSFSTEVAEGATTALTWPAASLRPGTYLIESGTHPSIQRPMGLYGMLVVTTAPSGTTAGTAYPAVGSTPAVTYVW
jgi:FtsP/CotA-like multicopper oxidase with cupredoxin domain